MAINRKLQAEIDRVLKRVQEGISEFGQTWEKVAQASTTNLKEKHEADLKKEIKKLQRYRDQIKSWASSSEVKNKKPLQDARKDIETEMERFKVLEKETKTKAYSKEALSQHTRKPKDPTLNPKYETYQWIDGARAKLKEQLSGREKDLDKFKASRKGKLKEEEFKQLQQAIDRHTWHLQKLLRAKKRLKDDTLTIAQIEQVREPVDFFIDQNSEPDFFEDTEMYDVLDEEGGDTKDDGKGSGSDDDDDDDDDHDDDDDDDNSDNGGDDDEEEEEEPKPKPAPKKVAELKVAVPVKTASVTKAKTPVTPVVPSMPQVSANSAPAAKKETPKTAATTPLASPTGAAATKSAAAAAAAPAKGKAATPSVGIPTTASLLAQAAAAKTTPSVPPGISTSAASSSTSKGSTSTTPKPGTPAASTAIPTPTLAAKTSTTAAKVATPVPSASTPGGSSSSSSASSSSAASSSATAKQPDTLANIMKSKEEQLRAARTAAATPKKEATNDTRSDAKSASDKTAPSSSSAASSSTSAAKSSTSTASSTAAAAAAAAKKTTSTATTPKPSASESSSSSSVASSGSSTSTSSSVAPTRPPSTPASATTPSSSGASSSATTSSIASLFDSSAVSASGQQAVDDYLSTLKLLEPSVRNLPDPMDTDRPKQYQPRNPHRTNPSFPVQPAPIFDEATTFEKFGTDTLFFIFYFQQGTPHQCLAARELKKQSWRYHKSFLTWFQRHDDPKYTTDEYEQGTYVFFDFETGWCQRIKTDFTFEYRHLEDEVSVPLSSSM